MSMGNDSDAKKLCAYDGIFREVKAKNRFA